MSSSTLSQRSRPLEPAELAGVPWLAHLGDAERERAAPELRISEVAAGEPVCRLGRPPGYWFGVVDGLLKIDTQTEMGHSITFSGITPGGWFGEGTMIKREPYRYNVQALRTSRVAGLPANTFHWLLDHSLGFNRFMMNQLNERLAHFIGTIEADRTPSPEQRVARHLAALVNPALFPGVGEVLRITQQELAYLVGLSRQRVNEALQALAARGLVSVEYGGLRILDRATLRGAHF